MLSAGNLGPGYSWDKRIKYLTGDSALLLNRSTWELFGKVNKCEFLNLNIPEKKHYNYMDQEICNTFNEIKIDFSKWVIPLSGGYDSRYILSMLKDKNGISTITWGSGKLRYQKGNDAYIAKKVAEKYGVNNLYFELDLNKNEIEKILNYFIICGEGRIDHLFGYTDGFAMWKYLFENNIKGIIRGDVCFSNQVVLSEYDVRFKIGFPLCTDFSNLNNYIDFGLPKQIWPEFLSIKKQESLQNWRDRIYQQLRIPVVLAALSDLKLPYIEVINPFLSKRIIYQSRKLPEHLRLTKTLFKKLAISKDTSGIEYARYNTYIDRENILKFKCFVDILKDELVSFLDDATLPNDFLKYVLSNLTVTSKNRRNNVGMVKDFIKIFIPLKLRNILKNKMEVIKKPILDFNVLAFRCYIICKINKRIQAD